MLAVLRRRLIPSVAAVLVDLLRVGNLDCGLACEMTAVGDKMCVGGSVLDSVSVSESECEQYGWSLESLNAASAEMDLACATYLMHFSSLVSVGMAKNRLRIEL